MRRLTNNLDNSCVGRPVGNGVQALPPGVRVRLRLRSRGRYGDLTPRELFLKIDDTAFELRVLLGHLTQLRASRHALLGGCWSAASDKERAEEQHGTHMVLRYHCFLLLVWVVCVERHQREACVFQERHAVDSRVSDVRGSENTDQFVRTLLSDIGVFPRGHGGVYHIDWVTYRQCYTRSEHLPLY